MIVTGLKQQGAGTGTAMPLPNTVPMLNAVPAAVIAAQDQAKELAKQEAALVGKAKSPLLNFLEQKKTEAVWAKQDAGITDRLLDAQRRRKGEHSSEKLAQIQKYKLPNYWVPHTQNKCIDTEAWLRDLTMPYGDKIWALHPRALPELQDQDKSQIQAAVETEAAAAMASGQQVTDEQIAKVEHRARDAYKKAIEDEAKEKAGNMEDSIQQDLEACGFKAVWREFEQNMTTYGIAFLKGPFTDNKKTAKWVGKKRVVEDKTIPACSAPSPHDIFPAPWAKDENDGYMIERIKTYRDGLSSVRKLPHYQTKEIEDLLSESRSAPIASAQYGDEQRAALEKKPNTSTDDRFELWQYTGPVPGFMLGEWGVEGCEDSDDYNVEALWCGTHIVKVVPMWNETGTRPYFRGIFKPLEGSFWGIGVPHLMAASQDRANTLMMAMLFNANWAAAPSGWIDFSACVNPDDSKEVFPGKFIAVQSRPGQTGNPIGINNIPLHVAELNAMYQVCLSDADNDTVPAYAFGGGGNNAPASGTYGGYTAALNAASKKIKDALLSCDDTITRFIQYWADWKNQYSDDDSIKGDIRVVASGALGVYVQEIQIDRMDALISQATSFIPLTGPRFVLGMIRQKAKMLKQDVSGLPTDDDLIALAKNPTPQAQKLKPSLSISAKWETLTAEEKVALMKEVGVQEQSPQPTEIQQPSSKNSLAPGAKTLSSPGAAAPIPQLPQEGGAA